MYCLPRDPHGLPRDPHGLPRDPRSGFYAVRLEGIEPSTNCLKGNCSTTELQPQKSNSKP